MYDANNLGFNSLQDTWGGGGLATTYGATGGMPRTFVGSKVAGGAGGAAGFGGMAGSLQDSWKKAQKANEERFQKMLELASQFGASQTAQAQDMHRQQLAGMNNSLVSRGLGNSTVRQGVQMTADKNLGQRLDQIGEQKTNLQMGVYQQHQDLYPDLQMYLNAFSAKR